MLIQNNLNQLQSTYNLPCVSHPGLEAMWWPEHGCRKQKSNVLLRSMRKEMSTWRLPRLRKIRTAMTAYGSLLLLEAYVRQLNMHAMHRTRRIQSTHTQSRTHTHSRPTHTHTHTHTHTPICNLNAHSSIQTRAYANECTQLHSWIYRRTFARTSNSKTINLHRFRLSYCLPADDVWQETFAYYALCPESACGSLKTPSRGVCSMGRCLCSVPWRGDDCEILGLAPKITPVSVQTITEGSNFDIVMTTSEVCSKFRPSYRKQLD